MNFIYEYVTSAKDIRPEAESKVLSCARNAVVLCACARYHVLDVVGGSGGLILRDCGRLRVWGGGSARCCFEMNYFKRLN